MTALFPKLTKNNTYGVQVFAYGAEEEKSAAANTIVAMPPACAAIFPGPPEALQPTLLGTTSMTVAWLRPASNPCLDSYQATVQDVTGLPSGTPGLTVAM